MTAKSGKGGKTAGRTLIPQPHGGALLPGGQKGQTPGPGRPRESIRVTMREHLVTLIPRVLKDVEKHKITALQAAELFARYGLGTQVETLSREVVDQEKQHLIETFHAAVSAVVDDATGRAIAAAFSRLYTVPNGG